MKTALKLNRIRVPLVVASAVFILFSFCGPACADLAVDYISSIEISGGSPIRLASDSEGIIYVAVPAAGKVFKFFQDGSPAGVITASQKPLSVAVDNTGKVFVGDYMDGSVRVMGPDGQVLYSLGQGKGEFSMPGDIAVSSGGLVYVTDSSQNVVKVYNPDGTFRSLFGGYGTGPGQMIFPAGICSDDANNEIYVVDQTNGRVEVFSPDGVFKRSFGSYGSGQGRLTRAQGIHVANGKVYVSDAYLSSVEVFGTAGNFVAFIGTFGSGPGGLRIPMDVMMVGTTLYVANSDNGRMELFEIGDPQGLDVSPLNLSFTAYAGANPLLQTVWINPSTTGSGVPWTATVSAPFGLNLSASSGTAPGQVEVEIDVSGLSVGTYTGAIALHANGIDYPVSVNLIVSQQQPQKLFGACGPANGGSFTSAPSSNLCSAGTPGTVGGAGPWTWLCAGANGGSDASCSANIQTYTVAVTSGSNGGISPSVAQTVIYGSNTSFTVKPDSGFHITSISGCNGSDPGLQANNASYSYATGAITSNCAVTATFAPNQHTLTVITAGTGSGTVGGGGIYDYGIVYAVTATASTGSTFAGWSEDCSGATSPFSVTMLDRDMACTATFTYTTPPVSTITSPTGGTLMATTVTITGAADDGAGTGVKKVELSFDGGITCNALATGTTSWSYDWNIPTDGTYTINSCATDMADNKETPGKGITVTVYKRQPSAVSISSGQMMLNGTPFTIKGVGYSPIPIGADPETTAPYGDYFTSNYSAVYDRDLPLLREMGANTVRLISWDNAADHHDFLDAAYNGGVNPVYVIATYWIETGLNIETASPDNVREQIKADFREMVAAHKNHPSILMWSIEVDNNADSMYGGNLNDLFSLVNEMAEAAHKEEGTAYHPVAGSLPDSDLINTISTYNAFVPSLDIWGVNVYRGNTFGTLFNDYEAVSRKPLVILEYGIDAYDNANKTEYENMGKAYQSDYAKALWNEIAANSDVCIGGSIAEYSDEWWKSRYSTDSNCTDIDPAYHGTCGFDDTSQPDGYSNEEWWGIMKIAKNGANPDIVTPRAVYYTLKELWTGAVLSPNIAASCSSLNFDNQNVGTTSSAQTITISNGGTGNLSIGSITLTGANPNNFKIQNDNCSGKTIMPSSSCTVQTAFTPLSKGPKSANMSIPSNDTLKTPLTVGLTGTGIDTLPPTGTVTINGGATVTKSATVTLTLSASDYSGGKIQMCISNTTSCTSWTAFAAKKTWALSTRDGAKTVNVWFKDGWGNANPTPYSASIILDTTAPVNGTLTGTPGNGQVTLKWSGFSDATSGIAGYKVVYATSVAHTSCAGSPTIYTGTDTTYIHSGLNKATTYYYRVCAIDGAGNMSSGATASAKPF